MGIYKIYRCWLVFILIYNCLHTDCDTLTLAVLVTHCRKENREPPITSYEFMPMIVVITLLENLLRTYLRVCTCGRIYMAESDIAACTCIYMHISMILVY